MQTKNVNLANPLLLTPDVLRLTEGVNPRLISLQQIVSLLFRRKALIFTMFLLLAAATVALALLLPARYKSSMKILVKNERADVVVSPEATTNVDRLAVREETINSEIELLRSNDLLQSVVVMCQLDKLEREATFKRTGNLNGEQIAIERATQKLSDNLEINPIKKANIIEVVYSSSNPELPATVLKQLAADYLEKHLRTHHTAGIYDFFKTQSNEYERQTHELKAQLAALHERLNLVDLDEQKKLYLTKLAELEADQLKAEAEFQANLNRAQQMRKTLDATSPRIQTQVKVLANQYSMERLNTMLVDLKNKRTQLLTKFHADDRLVKEVETQIQDTQAALNRAGKDKEVEEFTDVNPVRPTLEGEVARFDASVAGLGAQKEKLAGQLSVYRSRLAQLEAVTNQHQELERAIKEAAENYTLYSKKVEESRIGDALDQKKFANVAVAESPVNPQLPYSPNRLLILSLGFLLAVFASLLSAFAVDYFSDAVHSPEELEAATGLPTFSVIPLLSTAELNTNRGKRAFSLMRSLNEESLAEKGQ